MTLTVHHLDNSRSHRILWLLEEIGLDYELVELRRNPETMRAPSALRDIHPLGKAPLVVTEDGEVLAESGAILEAIVERHAPQLAPDRGTPERTTYSYFMHYAEGSLMPPLLVGLILSRVRSAPLPFFVRPVARTIADKVDDAFTNREVEQHLAFIEAHLKDRQWFCGEHLTAADIQMSFPLMGAEARLGSLEASHPSIHRFIEAARAREAWKRAELRGGVLDLGSARGE